MAGIIASTKSQWLKSFPPIQQKALAAVTTN